MAGPIPTRKIPQLTAYGAPLAGAEQLEIWATNTSRRVTARDFVLPAVDPLITAVDMSSTHPASRFLQAGVGIAFVDNGPGNSFVIAAAGTGAVSGDPTAQIGLTAVNGSALTWMRSDAAPALDQSIAPTWTGVHIFSPNTGMIVIRGAVGAANQRGTILRSLPTNGFSIVSAADATPTTAVSILLQGSRSGTAWNALRFGNTTDNPAYIWNGSGTWSVGGSIGTTGQVLTSGGAGVAPTWTSTVATAGFADGTAALPSIFFTSDTNTGIYRVGADQIGFSTAGVVGLILDQTQRLFLSNRVYSDVAGTAALPAYSWTSDSNTGVYQIGADRLGFAAGGVAVAEITATGLYADINGTAAAPVFSFINDTDTGIYLSGTNTIGFTAGGSTRMLLNTTFLDVGVTAGFLNGSAGAPSVTFSGDLNTGLYLATADMLAIAAGGTFGFGVRLNANIQALTASGSATNPGLAFNSDQDTGIYSSGTNTIGFAAGGTRVAEAFSQGIGVLNGTAVLPSVTFILDTNTGMYLFGSDTIGFSAGGVNTFQVRTGDVISLYPHYFADGTVSLPGISFVNDADTGIRRVAANNMELVAGGVSVFRFVDSGGVGLSQFFGRIHAVDNGLAGTPAYSFDSDPDTGMYRGGANNLRLAIGGINAVVLDPTVTIMTQPLLRVDGVHNGTLPTGAGSQYIGSGTYTPTVTATVNLDSTTPQVCQWMRVGNVVTVSGEVTVDPTALGLTQFELSLPLASNLASPNQLVGAAGVNFGPPANMLPIRGSAANDTAIFQWSTTGTSAQACWFSFTYLVA